MYGVTKEQEYKFMKHIVDTKGEPRSSVARECNLEGYFEELCMRRIPKETMVEVALEYLVRMNIRAALKTQNHDGTWFTDLGYYNGNRWAIAIAWMDYDGDDNWRLYGKVAYQPSNSIMQCDYDIDWTMPYDEESGEVNDTETLITSEESAKWLLGLWQEYRKELYDECLL